MDRLEGGDGEKRRLRIVLETLSGELSVEQACEELGVSASRFHEIRREALQAALDGLAPGASGRPKHADVPPDPERVKAIERENAELKAELQASYVRTEIALAMPHVLTEEGRRHIKKKHSRRAAGDAVAPAELGAARDARRRHPRRASRAEGGATSSLHGLEVRAANLTLNSRWFPRPVTVRPETV